MIRWAMRKAIDKFERTWNYDAGYMRELIDVSPRAAWLVSRAAAIGQFRRDIPKRWGRRALVSLAFAITASRLYPTVKYALGHGKACMRVVVGGEPVALDHGRTQGSGDVVVHTH